MTTQARNAVAALAPDLRWCAGLALAAVVLLIVPAPDAVRAAVGIPMALGAPGYAVVAGMFGARLPEPALRLVLAAAASFGVAALGSVALDALTVPLTRASFTLLSAGCCAVGVVVAARRRAAVASEPRAPRGRAGIRLSPAATFPIGGAALAVAALLAASQTMPSGPVAGGQTSAWGVRTPTGAAQFGLINDEPEAKTFRIVISARQREIERRKVRLRPGSEWRIDADVGRTDSVEMEVYRAPGFSRLHSRVRLAG